MRQRLKHIKTVRKRLADGSVNIHRYHRRTGKRIEGLPGTSEFLASYLAASSFDGRAAPNTLATLIADYKADSTFSELAERTRADYARILDRIADRFGNAPLGAFEDKRMRRDIRQWRDAFALRSRRQADYHLSVLSALIGYGVADGRLSINVTAGIRKLYQSDRADKVWTDEDIAAFGAVANLPMRLALHLGLDLGQREGDLIRVTLAQYQAGRIALRQRKGGRRIDVRVTAGCRELIAEELDRRAALKLKVEPVTLLTGLRGRPWTEDGFRTEWHKAAKRAGISGRLTYHDLRGSCVTRLYEAGNDLARIVSITGHSLRSAESIIDRYLARTRRLADDAIENLERERNRRKSDNQSDNRS